MTVKGGNFLAIGKESDRVTAIISKETLQKIAELALKETRSISAMTAILIEKGLQSYQK